MLETIYWPTFVQIVGWQAWKKRLVTLRQQIREAPAIVSPIMDMHALELEFGEVFEHRRKTGRFPWPVRTPERHRLYQFAACCASLHSQLSEKGKNRLKGVITHSLKNDAGFISIEHEMNVLTHLSNLDFEVTPADLEGVGQYDYLASKGDIEVEVECKTISGDAGRPIHRKDFARVSPVLIETLNKHRPSFKENTVIRITIPDRLPATTNYADSLCGAMDECMDVARSGEYNGFQIDIIPVGECTEEHPAIFYQEMINSDTELKNCKALVPYSDKEPNLILAIRSEKETKLVDAVIDGLKTSDPQFSRDRNGYICCYVEGITGSQWSDINKNGYFLNRIEKEFLSSDKRKHILGISFYGMQELVSSQSRARTSTAFLVILNVNNPDSSNPGMLPFPSDG